MVQQTTVQSKPEYQCHRCGHPIGDCRCVMQSQFVSVIPHPEGDAYVVLVDETNERMEILTDYTDTIDIMERMAAEIALMRGLALRLTGDWDGLHAGMLLQQAEERAERQAMTTAWMG